MLTPYGNGDIPSGGGPTCSPTGTLGYLMEMDGIEIWLIFSTMQTTSIGVTLMAYIVCLEICIDQFCSLLDMLQ